MCFFDQIKVVKPIDESGKGDYNNCDVLMGVFFVRIGNNIRLRKDGRYEARYIKSRDSEGHIIYGYCYGQTYEEAESKRDEKLHQMQPMRELSLLILGAGSHGEEVMELAQSLRVFRKIDFLDDARQDVAIGPCRDFEKYLSQYPVAIPAVGDTVLRTRWMNDLAKIGFLIPTLIHPTAVVSQSAQIGVGTVICARATIGTGAVIGKGCIISSGATVNRNVLLPDWSYVECGEVVST